MPRLAAALFLLFTSFSSLSAQSGAQSVLVPAASGGALPLAAEAESMGARFVWDPLTSTGFLERGGFHVSLKAGFAWFVLDGNELLETHPVEMRNGVPYITSDAAAALRNWFEKQEEDRSSQFHIAAILLDPGHGGKDPGAVSEHVLDGKRQKIVEKDLALSVALHIRDRLKERWPGRRILLTRDSDTYPTLEERVDIANSLELGKNEAVIYVSIHANASFNKNARGYEVWYLNPDYRRNLMDETSSPGTDKDVLAIKNLMLEEEFTTESVLLAKRILDGLGTAAGTSMPNRGLRAEEWFVVRNAKMPSVLVELGFVTNPVDAALLLQDSHLRKLGDGIYTGIVDFVEYFENRKGPPSS